LSRSYLSHNDTTPPAIYPLSLHDALPIYKNVELVGEYKKWSEDDFRRANAKRRELGMTFDTTAGLAHGVGDPRAREALLADLKRSEEHTSELQSPCNLVCRLLLEKKKEKA